MIYGFVQDASIEEFVRKQRETIIAYAENHALKIDEWLNPSSFSVEVFKEKDDFI